ncbi:MAG: hypothetical protein B7Z66_06145 [Chromatiales bacterium 21-64-14]|nr:MAG: hypothetical protein B7Z66_06145 [Chromatiales bacterium 21-64-14]HQU15906.1 dihydrofolate reductase family protein [Gammaproteobacteria bacterium]
MSEPILRLYPGAPEPVALEGAYLAHGLHRASAAAPMVYTNFIASLDGRIALVDPGTRRHRVPAAIANPRDWRLFQELAAQAHVLVTTARYFRDLTQGQAQDSLPVSTRSPYADLLTWRRKEGLEPQPAVAVVSASLDLPIPPELDLQQRAFYVLTGEDADPDRVTALEQLGLRVLFAGNGHRVDGRRLVQVLAERGYHSLYAIAGPQLLHTLVSAGVLDRLYLTHAHRLLGGVGYDTILEGSTLDPAVDLRLEALYYDSHAPAGAGQSFGAYACCPRRGHRPGAD